MLWIKFLKKKYSSPWRRSLDPNCYSWRTTSLDLRAVPRASIPEYFSSGQHLGSLVGPVPGCGPSCSPQEGRLWGRGLCVGEQLPGVQTLPAQPSFWCFQNELRSPPLPFSPPVALVFEHQSCCCFRARRRLPRRLELISFFSSFNAGTEQPGTEAPHSWRENRTAPAVNEMRKIVYAWLCSRSSDGFP